MSSIEWTEKTWNPVAGCSRVSSGCENCYAERMAWRLANNPILGGMYAGTVRKTRAGNIRWTGKINLIESALDEPLTWRRPRMVFVNSMSDLFHENIPVDYLMRIWDVIRRCPQHTFQILTKRPENILDRLPADWGVGYPNVWLGVSVENEAEKHRMRLLCREVPAAVTFVSFEPLLADVPINICDGPDWPDWVIIGGESGPGARPCDINWIANLASSFLSIGAAVFIKQLGAVTAFEMDMKSRKGADWNEWPEYLRLRQYPGVKSNS